MIEKEKLKIVKSFFEDENYRDFVEKMYDPEMKKAIESYLIENHDFKNAKLHHLVACRDLDKSQQLKDVLFKALDLWAENHFEQSAAISQKMEAYILRVSQTLEDHFSPGKYTNPVGLKHIDVLKQYLNKTLKDENKAALWKNHFPVYFQNNNRYSYFALVFLILMLDENKNTYSKIMLDEETLAMLVNCGYHYIAFSGANPHRAFEKGEFKEAENIETIFALIMELAVKNRFYQYESHYTFEYALAHYINYCIPKQFVNLLLHYDEEFNKLACLRILKNLKVNNSSYQKEHRSEILTLVKLIPESTMCSCKDEWKQVLEETKK